MHHVKMFGKFVFFLFGIGAMALSVYHVHLWFGEVSDHLQIAASAFVIAVCCFVGAKPSKEDRAREAARKGVERLREALNTKPTGGDADGT